MGSKRHRPTIEIYFLIERWTPDDVPDVFYIEKKRKTLLDFWSSNGESIGNASAASKHAKPGGLDHKVIG